MNEVGTTRTYARTSGRESSRWAVVFAAAVGLSLGFVPVIGFTFSVFFKSLISEFHWSRSEVSLGFSLSLVMLSIVLPLTGKLVDRFGARRIVVPSAVLLGLGLMACTLLSGHLWQFYTIYLFIGLAASGTVPTPYYKVITCWFDRRRGLALGIAMGGAGLGSSLMPYLAQWLIAHFGWRAAYLAIGLTVIAITVPVVSTLLKEGPVLLGVRSNRADAAHAMHSASSELQGMSGRDARRSGAFWLMSSSFFLMSVALSGCLVHIVPLLTDRGMSANTAAMAASVVGAATLLGRVGTGYLLDRFAAKLVAMMLFALSGMGIGLLWSDGAGGLSILAAFLIGMGLGAEGDVMAYMVSRYFGVRTFGEIYGWILAIYTVGAILGPMLMATGFDATHSYNIVLGPLFATAIAAAVLIGQLGPYRWGLPKTINEQSEDSRLTWRKRWMAG